jgi:hypothetical protein
VEGIFWIGIGLFICILAWKSDLGSFVEPGPGFVAFLSGLFISCVGLVMIVSKAVTKNQRDQLPDAGHTFGIIPWPRLVYTMALLLAYAVLIDPLGYLLATFFSMFGLFFDWGKKNWFWSLFFSISTALVSYLMFEVWLRCQLPRGIFPWW